MKRIACLLLFCLLAWPVGAVPVVEEAWVQDAAMSLVRSGLLQAREVEPLVWGESISRLEMAVVVGRAWERVYRATEGSPPVFGLDRLSQSFPLLSMAEWTALQELTQEFSRELNLLGIAAEKPPKVQDEGLRLGGNTGPRSLTLWDAVQVTSTLSEVERFGSPNYQAIGGEVSVVPWGLLRAEYRQGLGEQQELMQLGAAFRLGQVEVEAGYQWVDVGFPGTISRGGFLPEAEGMNLTLRLGDLYLATFLDRWTTAEWGETGLWPSRRPGYEPDPSEVSPFVEGGLASFGVDLSLLENASLKAGVLYGTYRTGADSALTFTRGASADLDFQLPWNSYLTAGLSLMDREESRTHQAHVGLGYAFSGVGSVHLGYRLIDFQKEESKEQKATAEISIRF